jgi:hypothetical protein
VLEELLTETQLNEQNGADPNETRDATARVNQADA